MIFSLHAFGSAERLDRISVQAGNCVTRIHRGLILLTTSLCIMLGSMQAQTIQFTTLPGTTATENVPYTGSILATINNTDPLSYSAPVLPSWLSLQSSGTGARKVTESIIPDLAGVAMDANNNIYASQFGSTNIYKITLAGNISLWATRPTGNSYAALVVDNYLYITIHVSGGTSNAGLYRWNLNSANPVAEPVQTGKGCISMAYKDGYLYAASFAYSQILRTNLSTLETTVYAAAPKCFGLGFDPAGNLIAANYTDKKIIKYNPTTESWTDIIVGLPQSPTDVKIDVMGHLYVSFFNPIAIRKYQPNYSSFVDVSADPLRCYSMSLTPEQTLVYGSVSDKFVYTLQTGVVLSGTPSHADVGVHPVRIAATNGSIVKTHDFNITVSDPNPPTVVSYSPAAGATGIGKRPTLTVDFNETVQKGSGMVVVVDVEAERPLQSLLITIPEISISGSTLTIPLIDDLPTDKDVAVVMTADAIMDANGNYFAGIENLSTWYFKTGMSQQAQTIAFAASASATYGSADFDPGATASSGLAVSYSSSDESIAKIVSGKIRVLSVGTVTITASQAGNDSYFPATAAEQTLTVSPKPITVSMIANASGQKVYDGNTDITLNAAAYQLNGLVGDDEVSVSGSTRFDNPDAGTGKDILVDNFVLGGDDRHNYSLTTSSATVAGNITPAPLVVTADPVSKLYGTADPALTYQISGLLSGGAVTGALTRDPGEYVGMHAITLGSLSAGTNYDIQYTGNYLTTEPAVLTITPDNKTKVYGESDPELTYQVSGLVSGDGLSGNLNRQIGHDVGAYTIMQGSLCASDNYIVEFEEAKLTITPAALIVKADAISKTYGDPDPELTYEAEGLVNGDELTGSLSRQSGQHTGGYDILPGSLTAGTNYTLQYTGAVFHIEPAPLTITAKNKTKLYGSDDPLLAYEAEGLVNGDALSGALGREPGKDVGEYAIHQGTLSAGPNYITDFNAAVLTITPAPLTIRAENAHRDAWQANPQFNFHYDGFVGGDDVSVLTTPPTAETVASSGSPAGKYDIIVSGASSPNYHISYQKGELTVNEIDRRELKVWVNGGQIQIQIFTEHAQKSTISLFSSSGQALHAQKRQLQPGVNNITIPAGNLAPAIYVLHVNAERFRESEQLRINR